MHNLDVWVRALQNIVKDDEIEPGEIYDLVIPYAWTDCDSSLDSAIVDLDGYAGNLVEDFRCITDANGDGRFAVKLIKSLGSDYMIRIFFGIETYKRNLDFMGSEEYFGDFLYIDNKQYNEIRRLVDLSFIEFVPVLIPVSGHFPSEKAEPVQKKAAGVQANDLPFPDVEKSHKNLGEEPERSQCLARWDVDGDSDFPSAMVSIIGPDGTEINVNLIGHSDECTEDMAAAVCQIIAEYKACYEC